MFSPHRVNPPKAFTLHLRRLLSKSISRCQGKCGKKIDGDDSLIVKSFGTSTWTDAKTGIEKSRYGAMYIHFRDSCLKSFDEDTFYQAGDEFAYNRITVDTVTAAELNEEEKLELRRYGINF